MKMKFSVLENRQSIVKDIYDELVEVSMIDSSSELLSEGNRVSKLLDDVLELNEVVKQFDKDESLEFLYGEEVIAKISNENFVGDIFNTIREWLTKLWHWIQGLFKSKKEEKPLKEIRKELKSAVNVTNQTITAAKQIPAEVIQPKEESTTKDEPKVTPVVTKGPMLNTVMEKELNDMLSKRSTIVHQNAILVLKEIARMYKEFHSKIRSITNPSASEDALTESMKYCREFKAKTSEKINELYDNAGPVNYVYLCKYADDEIDLGDELDTNTILLTQCEACKKELSAAEASMKKDKKKNKRLQLRIEVLKAVTGLTQSYKPLIDQLKKDTNYLQNFLLKLDDKYLPYLPENIKKLRNK